MHETGLALEILEIARDARDRASPGAKVSAIHIQVGRWSGAEPQTLEFALKVVADSTDLEGTAFHLSVVEPSFLCKACGREFTAEDRFQPCPFCQSDLVELTGGDELAITHLDVEDDDPAGS